MSNFKKGSVVRILDDKAKVRSLQEGHGGWIDPMEKALGKVGKVMLVHFTGDIHVAFGGQMWTFNPECCVPAPESELTPDLGLDGMGLDQLLKGLSDLAGLCEIKVKTETVSIKGEGSKELLEAIEDSDVEKLKKVFEKFPKLANGPLKNGMTGLHIAAKKGKLPIVKFLVEKDFNKDAKDAEGNTPLLKALDRQHVDVARFLIEAGTDLDVINDSGQSTLHLAVKAGDATLVRDLIMRGCDVNNMDNAGDTALHDAIAQNEATCAEIILMSPNLDLTIVNEKGFNPLHWATFHGKQGGTLVRKILQRNKDLLEIRLEKGPTALHIAAINDHVEAVDILIKQGANVNIGDKEEDTPLHLACSHRFIRASKLLVEAGADVNAANADKITPLHVVLAPPKTTTDDLDDDVVGGLLKHLLKDQAGTTQSGMRLATYLLEHGADVTARNKDDKTPLDVCTNKNLKKAVENFKKDSCSKSTAVNANALLCSQCFTRIADVTLLPCNHKMTCQECHTSVSACPLCGGEVTEAVNSDKEKIAEGPTLNLDLD